MRRPVTLFLVLTFGWAWLLWGYWVFAMPPGGLVLSPSFLVMAMLGGFAPSLAALATVRLTEPRGSLRGFLVRSIAPPDPATALLALLLAPAIAALGWLLQSRLFAGLAWPDVPALLPVLLVWPLFAALGEELGWRGLLFPRLVDRRGLIPAALLIGLIWGVWHLPADFVGLKATGGWFWLAFLVNGPFVLTGHALVMAALWRRRPGNVLQMLLYHWGITAAAMLAPSPGPDPLAQIGAAALSAALVYLAAAMLFLLPNRSPTPTV